MADGDQRIFPTLVSPNIRLVSKNSAEPTYDILTYRVTNESLRRCARVSVTGKDDPDPNG